MSNFCNKHNKAKVHRKKPMRGWHCNECNNEKRQQWYKNDPRVVMLQSAKHRAKRDGVRFNLKKADIIIPIFCPVLGVPLQSGTRKQHDLPLRWTEFAQNLDMFKAISSLSPTVPIVSKMMRPQKNLKEFWLTQSNNNSEL